MPIIKSAIKQDKKSKEKSLLNRHYKTKMQTFYKKIKGLVIEWRWEEALMFFSQAFSAIDTAAKKNLIHKNNASRKKSSLSKVMKWIEWKVVSKWTIVETKVKKEEVPVKKWKVAAEKKEKKVPVKKATVTTKTEKKEE